MKDFEVYLLDLFRETIKGVGISLSHNWKILLFAILIAVALKTYVNSDKLSKILFKKKKISIFASVLFGTFTPLCACGTTAVIIGMLTSTFPWGPIMAFLTSSPLMSPDGFIMIAGVINLRFAIALTVASLMIGIASGFITNIIEKKTNYLTNQSRFAEKTPISSCSCSTQPVDTECACAMSQNTHSGNFAINLESATQYCCDKKESRLTAFIKKYKLVEFAQGIYDLGLKQILLFYVIFIAIGFLINHFVPTSIISVLLGSNSFFAVPLASLIGLPLYLTTNSGIPIVQSLIASGASEGAMLAFMITGAATSAWVIAGLATFMKRRAVALYVLFVLLGGIISGYVLNLVNLFM